MTRQESRLTTAPLPTDADPLRPWLLATLTALVVCRPLFPSESAAVLGDGLPVVMLWLSLPLLWLLGLLRAPISRVRFGWVDGGVMLLMVWHATAGVHAVFHGSPRPAFNQLWQWIALGVAFCMARQLIVGGREARAVVVAMLALATTLAAYGLYQQAYELPATRAMYAADPNAALRSIGVWYPPGSPQRMLFEKRLASQQPMATFALTNSLAAFLVPWLIVALGVMRDGGDRPRRRCLATCLWALPMGACLLLTQSRSSYLAGAVGLAVLGVQMGPIAKRSWFRQLGYLPQVTLRRAVVGLLFLGIAGVAASRVQPQWFERAQRSLGYRLEYWQASLAMIADAPLWGCGPGNFQAAYTRYKLPQASEEVADPHNLFLEIGATAGLPALAFFLATLVAFAVRLRHGATMEPQARMPDQSEERPRLVAAGAVAGVLIAPWVSAVGGSPTALPVVLLGVPLMLASFGLAWRWINTGQLSAELPALGVLILLVNLLAAGGIGYPAVADSLWLLLALGLNLCPGDSQPRLSRVAIGFWAALAVGVCVACYQTGYRPVVEAEGHLRRAAAELRLAEAELQAAAAADPYAARPWLELATRAFSDWKVQPKPELLDRCKAYLDHAVTLEPKENGLWMIAGDLYLEIYAHTKRGEYADKAAEGYRHAVALYPHNATLHAKRALALQAQGAQAEFRAEAAEALRLDGLTPHEDKKLPTALRESLQKGLTP